LFRRQIDYTGWNLVFTADGKYFFHDTVEGCSKYQPPEHLLEYLLELAPEKLDSLFDPEKEYVLDGETFQTEYLSEEDYIVPSDEALEEIIEEKDTLEPAEQLVLTHQVKAGVKKLNAEEYQTATENYNQMLMDSEIDPFQSWNSILSKLSSDPRFNEIPSAKERRALFDAACPALAERARERRRQRLDTAEDAWRTALDGLTLATAPTTWTEYSRHIRQEEWFRLLDSKKMEREYRDRLRDLVERSRVYQIPR
jgi:hypothetical protein